MDEKNELPIRRGRKTSFDLLSGIPQSGTNLLIPGKGGVNFPIWPRRIGESFRCDGHWIRHFDYPYAALEILLSGGMEYLSSGKRLIARAGDLFFISHLSNSRYTRLPELGELHKIYLIMDGSLLGVFLKELGLEEDHLFHLNDPEKTEKEIRQMVDVMNSGTPDAFFQGASLLVRMLFQLSAQLCRENRKHTVIDTAKAIMRRSVDQPLSNGEIAQCMSISTSGCYKRFVAIEGLSPHRKMRSMQLERAEELLKRSSLKVGDVAEQCGFSNVKYFITLFRKIYGTSPGAYRTAFRAGAPET